MKTQIRGTLILRYKGRACMHAREEAPLVPVATASTLPITAGGFKIILKDAKIYAKKVIIRSLKSEKQERG